MANAFMTPGGRKGKLVYMLISVNFNLHTSYGSEIPSSSNKPHVAANTKYIMMADPNKASFTIQKPGTYSFVFSSTILTASNVAYGRILLNNAEVSSGSVGGGGGSYSQGCAYTAKLNKGDVVEIQLKLSAVNASSFATIAISYLG